VRQDKVLDVRLSEGDGRPRRLFSKGFIGTLAVIGVLGVSLPALAGSAGTGNVIYYAKTGPDGVIHCAGYNSSVGTASGYVASATTTYVAKDLYCVNADSYPDDYFAARTQTYNSQEQLCEDSGWVWNSSPSSVQTYMVMNESACPTTSQYYTLGQNDAAVNLGWQYTWESSGWANK
jgi:hypothetical protein